MLTMSTARDTTTTGFLRSVVNDGMGNKYHGIGSTKEESEADAMRAYRKYESCRNPVTSTLASDTQEQVKLMAGLIEKAKREGLDGRLIAMANTDFERGFMPLEKAINTKKG